ncbi:hypothetical protein BY458DRAFT_525515 [Sporodiniella umbellata]|nr:hypothetical protein BY458DRAFT_525515 [Sporodiniella umbellata]
MYHSTIVNTPGFEKKLSLEAGYFSSHYYREQKGGYSIKEYVQLASQVNTKHDSQGCYQCSRVCGYYMAALKCAREREPIRCHQDLFELVSGMVQLALSHRETSTYQVLPWFDMMTLELWDLAKQLKEESKLSDLHQPIQALYDGEEEEEEEEGIETQEAYLRAIRIAIYHCRALVCEQHKEIDLAVVYYRKALSVRPSPLEPSLQSQAKAALLRLLPSQPMTSRPSSTLKHSSHSFSSCDSSLSSSSTQPCAHCGLEKPKMPVCSRCRVQPYCSVKCIKAHQPIHLLNCSRP